jgi:hypothetical protein
MATDTATATSTYHVPPGRIHPLGRMHSLVGMQIDSAKSHPRASRGDAISPIFQDLRVALGMAGPRVSVGP